MSMAYTLHAYANHRDQCFVLASIYALITALWSFVRYMYTIKIVSEYAQEIPQSQTADNPVAPRGRAIQPSRDTRKTN